MERDQSYDEAITPTPHKGSVLLLVGDGETSTLDGTRGIAYNLAPVGQRLIHLDPLDGPVKLERWGVGGGIAFDGEVGDDPRKDPNAYKLSPSEAHIFGTLPDGQRIFTAPVTEALMFGPSRLAFVADGLCFELGEPDPDWANGNASLEVEGFMQAFKPLSTEGWMRGLQ